MPTLQQYENKLRDLRAEFRVKKERINYLQHETEKYRKRTDASLKAQGILQLIAEKTQANLQIRITSLVNSALEAVHPNPPKFIMNFTTKNNVPNCELLIEENGKAYKPLYGGGYGIANIISFALRIAAWSLKKTRNVLILDEPFHFLSKDLHEKAGEMVKEISRKIGMQFIIVSHSTDLIRSGDSIFGVTKKGNISKVTEL